MEKEFSVQNPLGIHSRPAGALMKKAKAFTCDITITKGDKSVNAKSIVGLLSLEMRYGDKVTVKASGEQEEEAVNELGTMLESVLE
ncbi:HPr family phosphocarrier protein [Paenibacillus sp. UNC499MF]|uniref:HPr family phosphocarrier protein n=1 Tax=Paenibacillus sp. UNC499MF TaxID=1502751 RepID=UPI0008A00E28|nr:HPr family phosphocarrier protein [Paenibacillus sp. UNC499MF]SEG17376.1 phosphocarrier protein [Paenibacillus sp. UNC499MF]